MRLGLITPLLRVAQHLASQQSETALQWDCGTQQLSMDTDRAAEISQTCIPVQFEPITYFGLAFVLICLAGGAGVLLHKHWRRKLEESKIPLCDDDGFCV